MVFQDTDFDGEERCRRGVLILFYTLDTNLYPLGILRRRFGIIFQSLKEVRSKGGVQHRPRLNVKQVKLNFRK